MINHKYNLLQQIGEGTFGTIYIAENYRTKEKVAIKIETIQPDINLLKNEARIYQYLLGTPGIPNVKWYGKDETNYYMVIQLLGKSLDQLLIEKTKFSLKLTLQIGVQLLHLLKGIHEKGLVHRDIKPDNFLLGTNTKQSKQLFLIDFGLCKPYLHADKHMEMKHTSSLIGSLTYASLHAHQHIELSRRDDLESLGYMLLYFSLGNLPWKKTIRESEIIKQKTDIVHDGRVAYVLRDFIIYIRKLEFEERPNYELFIDKFTNEI